MKVKIGNKVYTGKDEPIMVLFDKNDKDVLKHCLKQANWQGKMTQIKTGYFSTEEEKMKWIDETDVELPEKVKVKVINNYIAEKE